MPYVIFHDIPGLENGLTKFHDFLGPADTLCVVSYHTWRINNTTNGDKE